MLVIAPVLRRGLVREDLVISHVVPVHVIARLPYDGRAGAQITQERTHCDIDYVIAEAPAIRPAARDGAAAKAGLDRAGESVSAKDTQARKPRVIGI